MRQIAEIKEDMKKLRLESIMLMTGSYGGDWLAYVLDESQNQINDVFCLSLAAKHYVCENDFILKYEFNKKIFFKYIHD